MCRCFSGSACRIDNQWNRTLIYIQWNTSVIVKLYSDTLTIPQGDSMSVYQTEWHGSENQLDQSSGITLLPAIIQQTVPEQFQLLNYRAQTGSQVQRFSVKHTWVNRHLIDSDSDSEIGPRIITLARKVDKSRLGSQRFSRCSSWKSLVRGMTNTYFTLPERFPVEHEQKQS